MEWSLKFLDDYCSELGLGNDPVIFHSEADQKAKENSILGKGVHPAQVALWWLLGELFFHFFKFTTLALLIVPRLAENLPYCGKEMDLSLAYKLDAGTMDSIQFEYLNLIAAYMLHALAESPSMGNWGFFYPPRLNFSTGRQARNEGWLLGFDPVGFFYIGRRVSNSRCPPKSRRLL